MSLERPTHLAKVAGFQHGFLREVLRDNDWDVERAAEWLFAVDQVPPLDLQDRLRVVGFFQREAIRRRQHEPLTPART